MMQLEDAKKCRRSLTLLAQLRLQDKSRPVVRLYVVGAVDEFCPQV